MPIRINLGCGKQYLEGWINCDIVTDVKADKHFDFDVFPYPFEAGCADEIFMDNVLEHLKNLLASMAEFHRILKPGGVLKIRVPYAKSDWAFQDPTHRHFFTERSMDYYTEDFAFNFYVRFRFKLVKAELTAGNTTFRHHLRNLIPFRSVLRYFLFNLYDGVDFELVKI